MTPPELHIFEPRLIARGPDEIRGQVGSFAFIFTKYADTAGNRWFVQPGHVGHESMTNTHEMLKALFGPDADAVYGQVVSVGEVHQKDEGGFYAPTGEKREEWDWRTIRSLAKRENLFGRSGILCGREVVMLWGDPLGWEMMLVEVLGHLGIGPEREAVVVVGNDRQYWARDFIPPLAPPHPTTPLM
jgi:hypothetical protein